MSLDAGTRIGRYEIQSLIGVGGMGEVYRALDTELNRPVALKFLHSDVAADQDRMSRFIQEARAASALNHPNILTVFDIGQTEAGARFFATEFVQGTTLREHIAARRLKLGDALDIAAQIASALAAAHAEGIVHRDIKPENVMVRADGYVKVLDFGLAKVTSRNSNVDTEAATRALVNTNPGAIMGTVAYMSPEQARGEAVDARTDIWSLGCVFYEMLTGHVPFEGRSASHVIVHILDVEPPPLAQYLADAPEALQEVVTDALTKDRDARFQTAKQMLVKLQRLRQRLDAGLSLEHSVVPGFSASTAGGTLGAGTLTGQVAGRMVAPTAAGAGRTTAGDIAPQDTVHRSGAESVAGSVAVQPRRKFNLAAVALVAFVVLGALAFGVYHFTRGPGSRAGAPFASLQNMKFTKLQAAGQTMIATLSPDGKYFARTVYENGKLSVRVRQLATTTEKELVAPSESAYTGLTFSPDGAFLYYVTVPLGGNLGDLYRVPSLLGGTPQKIISDVDSAVTFSPDGKQFAFRRHIPDTGADTIVVANEDGGGERTIVSRKAPIIFPTLAWSPDGQQIAFSVKGTDDQGYYMNVESVRPEGGAAQVVSSARWRSIGILAWLSDGSGLVFNGRDRASLPSTPEQIWFVAYPGGEAQKITNDLNSYKSVSLTADSRTLLALQSNYSADIWLSGGGGGDAPRQLTNEGSAGTPSWMPDGRIVYQSGASGNGDIWVMNADGTGARQLTFDPNNDASPEVSPDGRLIVFISNRSVGWSIWLMNADGSGQRELVRNVEQYSFPHFAPDSRTVYYASRDEGGRYAFLRVGVEGGTPARVTEQAVGNARLSPDGKLFFSMQTASTPNAPRRIIITPVEGGAPVREFDAPAALDMLRWSPDSQGLDYVVRREGASGLWRLPVASSGQPRQLADLKTYFINWYAWSPDGRQLAVARGNPITDLILIKDFK